MTAKGSNNTTGLQILFSTLVCCLLVLADNDDSYTVSIYQPWMKNNESSNVNREGALALMNRHIAKYELGAEEAARRKSQILVFPEYCLYADITDFSRESLGNFLETIPDPKVNFPWTPCDIENTADDITIQKKFSCMAKKNKLYIVANTGEREACNRTSDSRCPRDGRYYFNTNVVYAPNGTLVSRYRKKHLFGEPYFNSLDVTEHEVFDTPFGRFASIICFDIYFQDTLQDLIKNKGVSNIIFPNMWFSVPLFSAVPFHASVAWATNINLISANIIVDDSNRTPRIGGSGFYDGMSGEFSFSHYPTLLTANMTSRKSVAPFRFAKVPKRKTPDHGNQTVKTYLVHQFEFKSVKLLYPSGVIGVCHHGFCCGLEYEFESQKDILPYWLSTISFFEFQACAVCTEVSDKISCGGIPTKNMHLAKFRHLRLFANDFETPFVFPQVVMAGNESYQVLNPSLYYSNGEIKLQETSPLYSMTLLDRIYPPRPSSTSHPIVSFVLVIGMLVLSLPLI